MAQLLQSPWVSAFAPLADAIVQAPGNRAKALYAQQQAANMEVDNAIAQARFDREVERDRLADERYQQEQKTSAYRWGQEQQFRLAERERQAAAERRAAGLHPGAVQKQGLDIEAGEISNEFARDNNPLVIGKNQADLDFAKANNPLLLRKGRAEADIKDMEANVEGARIDQMPSLVDAVVEPAYEGIRSKMPEWNLQDLLKTGGPGVPSEQFTPTGEPPPRTPGAPEPTMDYAQPSPGMDEMSRRMGVEDNLRTQAQTAVLDKTFNGGDWVKKAVDAGVAAEPNVAPDPTNQYGDTDKGRAIGTVVRLRDKERNNIPLTPQEDDELKIAMSMLSPTEVSTIMGQNGDPVTTTTNVDIFGEQGGAGVTQPPAQPVQTQVQPQTQAPALSSPMSAAAQTQPPVSQQPGAGAPVRTQQVGNVTVTQAGSRGEKPPTEFEGKARFAATNAGVAFNQMAPLIGFDPVTGVFDPKKRKVQGANAAMQITGDNILTSVLGGHWAGSVPDPEVERYQNAAESASEPIVRFVSGAATPPAEFERSKTQYIPSLMEDDATIFDKIVRFRAAVATMNMIADRYNIDPMAASSETVLQPLRDSGELQGLIDQNAEAIRSEMSAAPGQTQAQPSTGLESMDIKDLEALEQQLRQQQGVQ